MNVKLVFTNGIKTITANSGDRLLDVLVDCGVKINTDCGGRGLCKKCKVKLIDGTLDCVQPDKDGYVLSCKAYIRKDCTIQIDKEMPTLDKNTQSITAGNNFHKYQIAFDLGTTTLAFSLIDVDEKKVIERYSTLNNQKLFGADVISRISASNDGNLNKLYEIIIKQLNDAINYFKTKYSINNIDKVVVAGNTTMLHLFLNVSPSGIGYAPYTPMFLKRQIKSGSDINVDANVIELLPSCGAFIGADITSGVYDIDLEEDCILIDLGTNGEIIYRSGDKYFATSTAAGPCLEGACIDCGIGGVEGAISKVYDNNDLLNYNTIGNAKPIGICGSGLVDTISYLLRKGIIDETGSLNCENDKFYITKDIFLSASDVRKFQLAKSAIYSGIYCLLKETGKSFDDMKKFYLAGGIGYHIDVDNAIFLGLLPQNAKDKVVVCGNSSLYGAEKYIIENDVVNKMDYIANNCTIIDLNKSKTFTEQYVENMFFGI